MDYTELIEQYQELNMANYNEDEVCDLNAWGVKAVTAIEALQARCMELGKSYTEELDNISTRNYELRKEKDAALARVTELEQGLVSSQAIDAANIEVWKQRLAASWIERDAALARLKALEKQEPFEYLWEPDGTFDIGQERQVSLNTGPCNGWKITPLYASPVPAKTLSDPEIEVIVNSIANGNGDIEYPNRFVFARAIEQALKGGA